MHVDKKVPLFELSIPPTDAEIETCQGIIDTLQERNDRVGLTTIAAKLGVVARICDNLTPPYTFKAEKLRDLKQLTEIQSL